MIHNRLRHAWPGRWKDGPCRRCGTERRQHRERPYPVATHALFVWYYRCPDGTASRGVEPPCVPMAVCPTCDGHGEIVDERKRARTLERKARRAG